MKTFRELTVWQEAHALVLGTYRATMGFPPTERYGLTSQMRRAAVSIAANIVEGHKRHGPRAFLQFLEIADASLEELKYYVLLAAELGYLVPPTRDPLTDRADHVGRLLHGLKTHIRNGAPHVA